MEDIKIICAGCNSEFIYDVKTQEYHASKRYQQPRFCIACRAKRRVEREIPKQTFTITCSQCGQEAQVTHPSMKLCRDCFAKSKSQVK